MAAAATARKAPAATRPSPRRQPRSTRRSPSSRARSGQAQAARVMRPAVQRHVHGDDPCLERGIHCRLSSRSPKRAIGVPGRVRPKYLKNRVYSGQPSGGVQELGGRLRGPGLKRIRRATAHVHARVRVVPLTATAHIHAGMRVVAARTCGGARCGRQRVRVRAPLLRGRKALGLLVLAASSSERDESSSESE